MDVLGPANGRTVVDAGAGTGWLSFRLALAGFQCFATDASPDPETGLGASVVYDQGPLSFERAIATLSRWPIRSASIDVAVCNASVHYLADIRPALVEGARVLRPGGLFVIMNSPVHSDSASAVRASREFVDRLRRAGGKGRFIDGHRHFVTKDLEATLGEVFSHFVRYDPDYGFGFRLSRSMKGALLRMELASFPIYVAREA